jgi:hypothetical protein
MGVAEKRCDCKYLYGKRMFVTPVTVMLAHRS